MNIIEYLEQRISALVAAAEAGQLSEAQGHEVLNLMEMEIREGIAQELEQLVIGNAPVMMHGIPGTQPYPISIPEMHQDIIRGAANVIRGKDPVTEDDWGKQSERMQAMAQLAELKKTPPAPKWPISGAEIFPMPTDAELQLKFEQDEERKREWND